MQFPEAESNLYLSRLAQRKAGRAETRAPVKRSVVQVKRVFAPGTLGPGFLVALFLAACGGGEPPMGGGALFGNPRLFLVGNNGTSGSELFATDGTFAGTMLVKDINPGAASSFVRNFTAVGDTRFFSAADSVNGQELWKTDGTPGGTVMVKNINPAGSSDPQFLVAVGSTLFFAANNGSNGTELWKSNGTVAGTVMVKDINAAANVGSNPAFLAAVGTTLYFAADDGTHGVELWKSDAAGTGMVKDIILGVGSS